MRVPVASYRLQFHKGFNFQQARALIPYLQSLGISDVYSSPIFRAGPDSTHGYDITGFDEINPNLGTQEDFSELADELKRAGMGLLIDMVPNHMGNHPANHWWIDILKNGRNSKFAHYFDINWDSPNPLLHGKVLLPILGDHYGAVLNRGELQVVSENSEFFLAYFDKRFPLSPQSIATFKLAQFSSENPNTPGNRQQFLAELNGRLAEPTSFDRLHQLIDLQHYRLAYWRVGPHEINYRRFFDVTELISVRVEDENVFNSTHKLLLDLVRSGHVTGLRIDHPDGLRDPRTYFERLQKSSGEKHYILAEKILSDDESLPADWPIHGTTGYDYLNYLNGLFIQRDNEDHFSRIYSGITGSDESFESLAFRSKQEVLNRMFIAEVNSLTRCLKVIASQLRAARDFTEAELRNAIIDFIAGFPIYRTYISSETQQLPASELAFIERGLKEAKNRTKATDTRALDFLAATLSLQTEQSSPNELRAELREFVVRFQQLSGPATAKGLEDTAFYRYPRFVSLNEVGGNPGHFGISPEEFHSYNTYKQQKWPHSMLATSTHDTKRGEDTRARLNVISEMPDEWGKIVNHWRTLNQAFKQNETPSANDEYLLYQSLVGTWTFASDPAYIERIQNYMLKASREAKTHTTWTEPNEAYESATKQFIAAIMNSREFVSSLSAFTQDIAYFGMFNSIAQVILKTCSPGVPDFYQGTEHWDLTLVDPDNRRPIDYALRQHLLSKVSSTSVSELLRDWQTGAIKVFATANALRIRREQSAITQGNYTSIEVSGAAANHLVAFARTLHSSTILVAVPRFIRTLMNGEQKYPTVQNWKDTKLEYGGRHLRNLLTGENVQSLSAAEMFQTFPAAILLPLD